MNPDIWSTRAYVVGEILISLAALVGGGYLLTQTTEANPQILAGSLITAVTVFWFSRRASEQANNAVTTIANGKLSALMASLDQQNAKFDALTAAVASKQEALVQIAQSAQKGADIAH